MGDIFGQALVEQVVPKKEVQPEVMDETGLRIAVNNELAKRSARIQAGQGSFLPNWMGGWTVPCVLAGVAGGYFLTRYFKKK
jgi:hypothetical protein